MPALLGLTLLISPAVFARPPVPQETETTRLLTLLSRFGSPAFGTATAIRHFGTRILETRNLGHAFTNIRLAPPPGKQHLILETHEGRLVGIQVSYTRPGPSLDPGALARQWGTPRPGLAPLDSFSPASRVFWMRNNHYLVSVIVQPEKRGPGNTLILNHVLLRRVPPETKVPVR